MDYYRAAQISENWIKLLDLAKKDEFVFPYTITKDDRVYLFMVKPNRMSEAEFNGKRIQQLRKERELTQKQLAEKLNVSQNTISKIESGLRRPSIDFLLEISEFFNVSTN